MKLAPTGLYCGTATGRCGCHIGMGWNVDGGGTNGDGCVGCIWNAVFIDGAVLTGALIFGTLQIKY